jgi:enamine deaminase RidA (YjgF/YER057c/UK114 family)
MQTPIERSSQAISSERRLQALAIKLTVPPESFGTYTEAVQVGSLDRVKRIVRLGVSVATDGNIRDQPKVADGASDFLQEVFGPDKNPTRLVYGVASLPLGTPVEVELIFEVQG